MKDPVFRGALALAVLFLSCDLLPTNEFRPTGTQFTLGSRIFVVSITGSPDVSNMGPITITFNAVSRTSSTESDVLPAGLLLARRNNQTQHLLLLEDQPVTAALSTTKTLLGTFCCNKHRNIPDADDSFELGPMTDNAELLQIVGIVKNKDISNASNMNMVQRAVQMVTDSTGLTQAYIDSLNSLPAGGAGVPARAWARGAFQRMDQNAENYSLPAGITIDSMYGELDGTIPESKLPLCLQVSNSNSGSIKVKFPAGLVFSPSSGDYEYMMLLKDFSFTAQSGVTSGILVPTYGCNEKNLDKPDDESFYDIGWRENDKEIQELLDLVASKALNTNDAVFLAQHALSEITDDSGLVANTRDSLKALP
jgi:hypothetical protein